MRKPAARQGTGSRKRGALNESTAARHAINLLKKAA